MFIFLEYTTRNDVYHNTSNFNSNFFGYLRPPHPPGILGQDLDGGSRRGLLWDSIPGVLGGDAGGAYVPHHIQCGGRCSSVTLCSGGVRERGWEGRA